MSLRGLLAAVALGVAAACGTADNTLVQNRGEGKDNWWDADVDFVLTAHNEPLVSSAVLSRLPDAFESIASGAASYVTTDGNREFSFDGFSILTK